MLATPHCGWSTIQIGDWSDRVSYISDVPNNILNAFIGTKTSYDPISVKFDAEGWEFIIVFDHFETHILDYGYKNEEEYLADKENKLKLFTFEISRFDIIKELVSDMERDLDDWTMWYSFISYHEVEAINKRKIQLKNKIDKLKAEYSLT